MEGFTLIDSRGVRGYRYDAESRTLRVVWASGRVYDHPHVTPEQLGGLLGAESVGAAFARALSRGPQAGIEVRDAEA